MAKKNIKAAFDSFSFRQLMRFWAEKTSRGNPQNPSNIPKISLTIIPTLLGFFRIAQFLCTANRAKLGICCQFLSAPGAILNPFVYFSYTQRLISSMFFIQLVK
ncbi:hypothetical protein ASJ33_01745 [Dehalococcoides mccartyi]|nr:hypothetical protein ASJ33_01745 [Dehalococcoides mccartyi]